MPETAVMTAVPVTAPIIEQALEGLICKQLLREQMRSTLTEPEREKRDAVLRNFADWARGYGLPTNARVFAAYLIELWSAGLDGDGLRSVADAYLDHNHADVQVPIRAALKFCSRIAG